MLDGNLRIWEIVGWLAGLMVIVGIDAARESRRRRLAETGLASWDRTAGVAPYCEDPDPPFVLDRSADEELGPEVETGPAWWQRASPVRSHKKTR